MIEKIPTLEEMGGKKAFAWTGWRLYKDNCRRRRNPNYSFENLPVEEQIADFIKFEKAFEEEIR